MNTKKVFLKDFLWGTATVAYRESAKGGFYYFLYTGWKILLIKIRGVTNENNEYENKLHRKSTRI